MSDRKNLPLRNLCQYSVSFISWPCFLRRRSSRMSWARPLNWSPPPPLTSLGAAPSGQSSVINWWTLSMWLVSVSASRWLGIRWRSFWRNSFHRSIRFMESRCCDLSHPRVWLITNRGQAFKVSNLNKETRKTHKHWCFNCSYIAWFVYLQWVLQMTT